MMIDHGIYEADVLRCHVINGITFYDINAYLNSSAQIFRSVQSLVPFGGIAEYSLMTARGDDTTSGTLGTYQEVDRISRKERCVIQFLGGNPTRPIITGWLQHPSCAGKLENNDGGQLEMCWNGIKLSINTDGDLLIEHKGTPKIEKGKVSDPSEDDLSYIKFGTNGHIEISNKKNIRLLLEPETEYARLGIDGIAEVICDTQESTIHVRAQKDIRIIQGDKVGIQIADGKMDLGNNAIGVLDKMAKFLEDLAKINPIGGNAGGPVVPSPQLALAATEAAMAIRTICG